MNETQKYRVGENFRKDWPVLIILAVLLISAFIIYPQLPEKVPIHWNIEGEVDNYGSRFMGAFSLPLLAIGIYAGMLLFPLIDPRRTNYGNFQTAYRVIRTGIVLFFTLLYVITTAAAMGYPLDIARIVPFGLGVLFIIFGLFMGQIQHNYFIGIRTPWTLASEEVWRKTHRVGGQIFVVAGIISILASFLPAPFNFWVTIIFLLGASLVAVVYSAFIYFNLEK